MGKLSELYIHLPLIEISEVCDSKEVPGKNGKQPWIKRWQEGFFLRHHASGRAMPFPVEMDYSFGRVPLAPGLYLFDSMNFLPNRFNEPELVERDRSYWPVPAELVALFDQDAKRG
jgi:hypothetical protein